MPAPTIEREPGALPPAVLVDAFRIAGRELSSGELVTLREFGRFARTELEPTAYSIDHGERPHLAVGDTMGGWFPEVVVAPEHARMLDRLFASDIGVGPYGGRIDWPFTFALMHEVADVGFLCSATVTLATVHSLAKWALPGVRERFFPPLVEGGGRAQGATWATEQQGGSDLGSNRTTASAAAGDRWRLTGEKFFCSNVGASCAVVTARPERSADGIRGLRLFFVPSRRDDGRPNWRVRRLKQKLGTTTVPTGEVSFEDAEAYVLGSDDLGPLPILEMLTVSRVANAVGSAAVSRRALEVASAYARSRTAFGISLADHPLLVHDLATLAAEADAASLLALESAFRFAKTAAELPPYSPAHHLMRLATHAAKLVTAEQAVRSAGLAMEVLGGIGYLEEFTVAKLVRDALVTPIWEGGANVHALDALDLVDRHGPQQEWRDSAAAAAASTSSSAVRHFLSERLDGFDRAEAEDDAKRTLREWAAVRQLTLMENRADLSPNSGPLAARAELFARLRSGGPERPISPGLAEAAIDAA
jgi:acyl-CoA dehydrogenase